MMLIKQTITVVMHALPTMTLEFGDPPRKINWQDVFEVGDLMLEYQRSLQQQLQDPNLMVMKLEEGSVKVQCRFESVKQADEACKRLYQNQAILINPLTNQSETVIVKVNESEIALDKLALGTGWFNSKLMAANRMVLGYPQVKSTLSLPAGTPPPSLRASIETSKSEKIVYSSVGSILGKSVLEIEDELHSEEASLTKEDSDS